MLWFALCHLFSCLVDLFTICQLTDAQKNPDFVVRSKFACCSISSSAKSVFLDSKRRCSLFWCQAQANHERLLRTSTTCADL